MRALLVSLLLCPVLSLPARAVFTAAQMERIDHEPLFDENYFLSLLSFAPPREWEVAWEGAASSPAYRINAASLDCCQLLLSQEARLRQELWDGLFFQFRLEQRDDKERQELHHWLEFEKKAGDLSFSLFGEPAFRKGDADIGLSLAYARGGFSLGARRVFVDFDFNRRSGGPQSYGRKPLSDQASCGLERGRWRFSASLELDHPLQRSLPSESRRFSYRRTTVAAAARAAPGPGPAPRFEYRHEFQVKENAFDPSVPGIPERSARRVHEALAAVEFPLAGESTLELGHAWLLRSARHELPKTPDAGDAYLRWEAQPYARWRGPLAPRWLADLGAFLALGENRRRSESAARASAFDALLEAKLGCGLEFAPSPSRRLGVYASFDLDAPRRPWGGGAARALFLF